MRKITKILLTAGVLGALLCGGALATSPTTDFVVTDASGNAISGDAIEQTADTLTINTAGEYTISMDENAESTTDIIKVGGVSGEVTLTLKDVDISTTKVHALDNSSGKALTIILEGDNSLVSTYDGDLIASAGLYSNGALNIQGEGSLTATGGKATGGTDIGTYAVSAGIYSSDALTITGSTIAEATGGEATDWGGVSAGIYSVGALTITGSSKIENATSGTASFTSAGIYSRGEINITDNSTSVTATGGKISGVAVDAETISTGIYSEASVTIDGSIVTATGETNVTGTIPSTNTGITGTNGVTITGKSKINATGGAAINVSAGISSNNTSDVTIIGSTIQTAKSGAADTSTGIRSGGALTITNSTIENAIGGNGSTSAGIRSFGTLTIEGDREINATGGTATGSGGTSAGIRSSDALTIEDGSKINATGGTASFTSAGIYSLGAINITGGTTSVTATGGKISVVAAVGAETISAGIRSNGVLTVDGSTVTATGEMDTVDTKPTTNNGIYGAGGVTIKGGSQINATGGTAINTSVGISSNGALTIDGSTIEKATGGTANISAGLFSSGALTIKDGSTITEATGGTADISAGLFSFDALTIDGSTVAAAASTATSTSAGLYSSDAISIKDTASVTVVGKTQGILQGAKSDDSSTLTLTADTSLNVFIGASVGSATEITNNGADLNSTVCKEENKYVCITSGEEPLPPIELEEDKVEVEQDRPYTPPTQQETTTRPTTGGTTTIDKPEANRNALVTVTPTPDDGYTVGQVVVTDKDGNEVALTENADGTFSFRMPEGGVEVEVTYIEGEAPAKVSPFTDLSEEDDAFEAVLALYEAGIINGMTETSFGGQEHINRAMITTMLHRMAEQPYADRSHFHDVADGQWYTMGIDWAVSVGLVDGYPDGSFNGTKIITNQEICKILRDYAIYMGVEVDETLTAEGVDDWASNAIAWAQSLGIFAGDPTAPVTRAQACKMICAVLEIIK